MTDFISHPDRWEHEQDIVRPIPNVPTTWQQFRYLQPVYSHTSLEALTQRVWEEVDFIATAHFHNHERQVIAYANLVREVAAWESWHEKAIEDPDRTALTTLVTDRLKGIFRWYEVSYGENDFPSPALAEAARLATVNWLRWGAGLSGLVVNSL